MSDEPASTAGAIPSLRRRELLAAGGALLLQALLPGCARSDPATTPGAEPPLPGGGFLTDAELRALRAFVDRMIPADTDPGALAARAAEAIDGFLSAFNASPPRIYAGGPYSDRGGHPHNHFADFLALDAYEAAGWRLALEGSADKPHLEHNGPVKGLQAVFREGLAQLDALAAQRGFADFAALPVPAQDAMLLANDDPLVAALIEAGFPATLDAMYGAPEYGGNADLAGWQFAVFDGDTQPRGYTDDQVVNADEPGPLDFLLPPSYHDPARRGGAGGAHG